MVEELGIKEKKRDNSTLQKPYPTNTTNKDNKVDWIKPSTNNMLNVSMQSPTPWNNRRNSIRNLQNIQALNVSQAKLLKKLKNRKDKKENSTIRTPQTLVELKFPDMKILPEDFLRELELEKNKNKSKNKVQTFPFTMRPKKQSSYLI